MPFAAGTVIRNALIVDGSGGEPREGDLAIEGARIVALGEAVV